MGEGSSSQETRATADTVRTAKMVKQDLWKDFKVFIALFLK
jgi:hypothetical protein